MKLHYVQTKLVEHYRERHLRRIIFETYFNWHRVITVDKQFKKIMNTMVSNIQKLCTNILCKDGFDTLNEFYNAKKVRQRLKMRILKYWARKTKVKIFKAIHDNVNDKSEEREMGLKCLIFETKRLKRQAIQIFKQNVIVRKFYKRLKMRALKIFSYRYKVMTIDAFKVVLQLKQQRLEQEKIIQFNRYKINMRFMNEVVQHWRQQISLDKDIGQRLGSILENIISQKQGFYQLKNYSINIDNINSQIIQFRYFKLLQQHTQHRKNQKQNNNYCDLKYQYNLKKLTLQLLQNSIFQQKQQRNELGLCLVKYNQKFALVKSFQQLIQYSNRQQLLLNLSRKLNNQNLQFAFRKFIINQKLHIFTDQLLAKIKIGNYFTNWKDFALEDKRLIKLQARANKHRNRVLKRKYYLLLKRKVCPKLFVLPKHRIHLLNKAIQAFKMNRIKQRVISFKVKKIKNNNKIVLKQRYLNLWHQKAFEILQQNKKEKQNMLLSNNFIRRKLLTKSINSMKKYGYMRRVYNYLRQRFYQNQAQKFMQNLKDGYISQRAKRFRHNKGQQLQYVRIAQKYFNIFKQYSIFRKFKQMQTLKARRQYAFLLAKKSLISFYRNLNYQKQKKILIQNACEERIQSQMREVFVKLTQVGMYWATIKQRFGIQQRSGRVYLGLKYGLRWRAKTLIIKFMRNQHPNKSVNKQIQLKSCDKQMTSIVRQKIIQTSNRVPSNSRPPLLLQQPQQQKQNSLINLTQRTNQSQISSQKQNNLRLKEIESEILAFKNKKLLLKELEQQYRQIQGNQQLQEMMKQKYMTLRNEIVQLQPKIKLMLEEIARLKGQQQQQSFNNTQQQNMFNQTFLSGNNDPSFMISKSIISNYQ